MFKRSKKVFFQLLLLILLFAHMLPSWELHNLELLLLPGGGDCHHNGLARVRLQLDGLANLRGLNNPAVFQVHHRVGQGGYGHGAVGVLEKGRICDFSKIFMKNLKKVLNILCLVAALKTVAGFFLKNFYFSLFSCKPFAHHPAAECR